MRAAFGRLLDRCERLSRENARLSAENRLLRVQLDAARRAGKRQAAPFSKGETTPDPGRGGRRRGAEHGRHGHRRLPDHVDETIEVETPQECPCCGGGVEHEDWVDQYQEEIAVPVRPHVRRYRVGWGYCRECGKRVQGRHPEQTSDASGAAAVQLGPRTVALCAQWNKELGLPVAKVVRLLAWLGVSVTAGGIYQALGRLAKAAAATYQALAVAVRSSAAVAADETGWRVCGLKRWLWVFVGDGVTVYLIAEGRGYEQAAQVLGGSYSGVIERDGWAPYRRFQHARHQSCAAHLLRRSVEMIADSVAGQAKIPHAVKRFFTDALAVRDAHRDLFDDGEVIDGTCEEIDEPRLLASGPDASALEIDAIAAEATAMTVDRIAVELDRRPPASADHAETSTSDEVDHAKTVAAATDRQARLNEEIARLEQALDQLLARDPTHPPNRRLLNHLKNERDHLLTFLKSPGVQATNWRAEQALRPAIVNRKQWGGNKTDHGAEITHTLMSVIRTSRQQDTCPIELLAELLRHPTPQATTRLQLPADPEPAPAIAVAGGSRDP